MHYFNIILLKLLLGQSRKESLSLGETIDYYQQTNTENDLMHWKHF